MKYFTIPLLCITGLLCLPNQRCHGQNVLAANYPARTSVSPQQEAQTLGILLKKLEKMYKTTFVYSVDIPENKKVDFSLKPGQDLESVLKQVLPSFNLKFRKLSSGGYAIVEDKGNDTGSNTEKHPEKTSSSGYSASNKGGVARDITGKVTDEKGEPLPGVTILIKGSQQGTVTNDAGNYLINVPDGEPVLIFSFIGYVTGEAIIRNQSQVNIVLKADVNALEELVVVGYGAVKKSSLTAAVTRVENKKLDQMPAGRIESALAGRLAGVSVVTNSATPGSAPLIRIRGVGSIDAENSPLIVIDGFPGGDLGQLNMNDVASIEVLKDASAAAIYGSRGAGGVILVTTKRGTGKAKLDFNMYVGVGVPRLHNDWLTGKEWYDYLVKYQNREFAWAGGDVTLPMFGDSRRPATYQVNPLTYELPQTVWQNEITQNAPIQNYNLSISGGEGKTRYFLSGSVKNEKGNVLTSGYKQYSLRTNLDARINDVLDLGVELNPSYSTRRIAGSNMVSLAKYPPFVPPMDQQGRYPRTQDYILTGHSGQASPYVFLYGTNNQANTFKNIGRVFGNIKIMDALVLHTSVGTNITFASTDFFRGGAGDKLVATQGSTTDYRSINLINENTLTYAKTFNKHDFTGLLGASYQKETSRSTSIGAVQGSYNNEIIQTLNNAVINPAATSTSKSAWGLVSYFGRINYSYNGKYLLAASIRTDASSRFGPDNKWALFPAFSAAWRISEENFVKSIHSISELKLRASYGSTGNFNIGDFAYLGRVGSVKYSPDNNLVNGQAPISFENTKLGWEKTVSYNLGLDLGLFSNRLYLSVDLYDKTTNDLLYNVSIPAITGFTSTITNVGEIKNKGIEVELTSRNVMGPLTWNSTFNFSHNQNKVVNLGGVSERIYNYSLGMSWILKVGDPMFSYYGYKMNGIYQNKAQVDGTPHLAGAKPGNPIIADANKDGKIDPQDKVVLGNFQPKYLLGFVNDFTYKRFDLNIMLQASLGAKMYNLENQYYEGNTLGAMRRSLAENQWWSEAEPGDGRTPAAALSQLVQYNANTDFYLENASFLTVRNLNFGYTFKPTLISKLGMSQFRIYASVNNLLMVTNKRNHSYNPEGFTNGEISGVNSIPGLNSGSEPINRAYALGLNVSF